MCCHLSTGFWAMGALASCRHWAVAQTAASACRTRHLGLFLGFRAEGLEFRESRESRVFGESREFRESGGATAPSEFHL